MIKRLKRGKKVIMAIILATSMVLSSSITALAADTSSASTSYSTVTEVYDWGVAVPRAIIDLGKTVNQGSVTKDTFKVHVVRTENRANTELSGGAEGDRTITRAYISDKDGNYAASGNYVTIEMEVGPTIALGSPINFSGKTNFNAWVNCNYTIIQQKDITSNSGNISGLVINNFAGDTKKLVNNFKVESGNYDNITMKYASYAPNQDGGKKPLIIWLHGMGEGGSDGLLPITANKADNFASREIQSYFGGAYVLAPQAPTFWMDGFQSFGDGTSKYEKALMTLIQDYVSKNNNIDKNRIYIGGDSNGGYMTMLMARDYTDYFAAAFPTCEALKDTLISDEDINKIKNIPIWFTAAKTDTTVPVNDYVVPTYNRLIAAGAKNAHLSLFDAVVDTTGLYNKEDGTPYEYLGHFSWIYVYNNQCKATIGDKTTTIMEWLSDQKLN